MDTTGTSSTASPSGNGPGGGGSSSGSSNSSSSNSAVPSVITRTWAKHEVLRSLDELRDTWRDYAELLGAGFDPKPLSEEKRALIEFHRGQFNQGRPPHEKMRDMVALLGDLLGVINRDTLAFRVPVRSALLPEEYSPELSRLSQRLHRIGEPLDTWAGTLMPVPKLADIVPAAPQHAETARHGMDEGQRAASLKAAMISLFKGVVRQDWADVGLVMSHINLVTTTSRSQGVIREVAHIAREIYDSLNEFSRDLSHEGLTQATQEIPDAVVKLNGVIQRLEEFAHASLDALEQLTADALDDEQMIETALTALDACDRELETLGQADAALGEELAQVRTDLTAEVRKPLETLKAHRQEARDLYLNLIANMGFQDLTGQTLRRVIGFIEDLQVKLMQLIARHDGPAQPPAEPHTDVPTEGPDPSQGRAPLSQESVDKMLANLGF